jgi:hypothetical protein
MNKLAALLVLLVSMIAFGQSPPPPVPPPVGLKISFIRDESPEKEIRINAQWASGRSRILLLFKVRGRNGVILSPTAVGQSPGSPVMFRRTSENDGNGLSTWIANYTDAGDDVVEEIYVAAFLPRSYEWSPEKDLERLKYLPFSRTRDIRDAIQLFDEFGWEPNGLTSVLRRNKQYSPRATF